MTEINKFIQSKYLVFLDLIAPLESRLIAVLFSRDSILSLAREHISKNTHRPSVNSILKRDRLAIGLPENAVQSVSVAGIIVFGVPIVWTALSLIFSIQVTTSSQPNENFISILQVGWQVLASLLGITFVVVVFVLQYSNERKYDGLASPLFFVETKIIFTASFGLLTILYIGISSVLITFSEVDLGYISFVLFWCFILFILNIFTALHVFVQAIRIITPNYFREKFRVFVSQRISDFVGLELEERLSETISLDILQKLDLMAPYFPPDWGNNNVKVELENLSRHINVISDVNVYMLKIVIMRAKRLLDDYKKQDIIFFGKLGHRVGLERPDIAFIHQKLNRPLITEFIRHSVKYIPIERANKRNLVEEIVLNGKLIKDAIESHDFNMVEELLEHYLNAIDSFLEAIQSYGVYYSLDSTNKENRFFSDWAILSKIVDQYIQLIDYALRCNDSKVTRSFLVFPFRALGLAIRYRDHLVFERISAIIPAIYRRSLSLGESLKYRPVVDYCLENLISIRRYHLEPALERADTEDKVKILFEYHIQFYVVWCRLMKIAIDTRDFKKFELISQNARQTLLQFLPKVDNFKLEELEIGLKFVGNDDESQAKINLELARAKQIAALRKELKEIQHSMFLGVGTWLTHLYDKEIFSIDEYVSFISTVNTEFVNIEELHSAYLSFHEEKWHDTFDWTSWEMNEWEARVGEMKSGTINFTSWVLLYYSVRGVEIVSENINSASPLLALSYLNHTIVQGIEQQTKYLQDNERWVNFVSKMSLNDVPKKINSFLALHQIAIRTQEINDEIDVRDAVLSQNLITKFQQDVKAAWAKDSTLRQIIQTLGRYNEYKDISRAEAIPFGINMLSTKMEFIEGKHISYLSQGGEFGRELANSEDHKLFAPFLSSVALEYDSSEFSRTISSAIQKLQHDGYSPIVLTNGRSLATQFYEAEAFVSRWQSQSTSYNNIEVFGKFEDTYVFDLGVIPSNTLVIVDVAALGVLNQYRVAGSIDFPLNIIVEHITSLDAENILQKNPSWGVNSVTKQAIDHEDAIRKILQHVSIQVWQDCAIEEINLKALVRIEFKNINNQVKWD